MTLKQQFPAICKLSPILAVIAVSLTSASNTLRADEVTKWNEIATKAAADSGLTGIPMLESRVYAMAFAAVHDALNNVDRRYRPYALNSQLVPNASPEAAVATAAHEVLLDQFTQLIAFGFSSQVSALNDAYTASMGQIPEGPWKVSGIAVGKAAAGAISALRVNDGWNTQPIFDMSYPQGKAPGQYRFTPGYNFALLPQWGSVPPFALKSGTQFAPPPPYPIDSKRYTQDYNEVKQLGGDGTITPSARTADQTEIALFWVESSPQMWNRISRNVSATQNLKMWENARLFALMNLGLADGYIACFSVKYLYNYWRPVTAIREGDADGNSDTVGDTNWTPLGLTPPIPEYNSGHGVEGAIAAGVLENVFHSDRISFQTCSETLPAGQTCGSASPRVRAFTSFSDAEMENGISRILVGIHYRNAVDRGIAQGRQIANWLLAHNLNALGGASEK